MPPPCSHNAPSRALRSRAAVLVGLLLLMGSCSSPSARGDGPTTIEGRSTAFEVRGEYQPLNLDRIERLSIEPGRLIAHGATATVPIELPASADTSQPTRHWAITTEADLDGKRAVTFTHTEKVQDFTLELPPGTAPIRFGSFVNRAGGEILVFTWNGEAHANWGYVTIVPAAPQR